MSWLVTLKKILQLLVILSLLSLAMLASLPAAAAGADRFAFQAVAQITSPQPFANVRGNVSITGTAVHPEFQRYELYYTIEPGENWIFIGEAHTNQVQGGLLGSWDTASLPDGSYSLRLRVVRLDGNYDEAIQRNIVVANAAPPPTPTPLPTPTLPGALPPPVSGEPTAAPPPEATPTAITVLQPDIPTPTPRPSPTATPEQLASAEEAPSDNSDLLASTFEPSALRRAFVTGLTYAGAIFLAVGAFFGVKHLLTWLWYLIAP